MLHLMWAATGSQWMKRSHVMMWEYLASIYVYILSHKTRLVCTYLKKPLNHRFLVQESFGICE